MRNLYLQMLMFEEDIRRNSPQSNKKTTWIAEKVVNFMIKRAFDENCDIYMVNNFHLMDICISIHTKVSRENVSW